MITCSLPTLYTSVLFKQLGDGACSRARVSRSELKGLGGANSPPRVARDMGSIALLSPVRADSHTNRQLGAAKVCLIHLHAHHHT